MQQKYTYSVLIRLLAIALSSLGALFLLPLVLNALGEYEFGIWGMVSSITGYLLLLDFGIALACTRYLSLQYDNRYQWPKIISNALLLAFIVSLFLILAAVGIYAAIQTELIPEQYHLLSNIIIITVVEVAISIPLRMYMSVLRTEVRYLDIGLFEIVRVCVRIGGIALGLYLGAGLMSIVLIGSVANLLLFILSFVSVLKRHRTSYFSSLAFSKTIFYDLLSFSKSTAVSQSAEFFKFRTDSVLVAMLIGITASAHYTIIVFIVIMLTQVLMRFLSYWDTIIISKVGENQHQQAISKLFKSLETGIAISSISLVNIIILGDTFILYWVGEKYTFLHPSLILLSLILLGITFQMATTPYFNALGKQQLNAHIDFGEIVLKLLLIIPMSAVFGLNGFIYSNLISALIFSIGLRLYHLSKTCQFSENFIYHHALKLLFKYLMITALLVIFYQFALLTALTQRQVQSLMLLIQLALAGLFVIKFRYFNASKTCIA
ncbi:MAG: hypothetical protein CSA50_02360 [Gammaproteobacteria bacterium]|nr:MAG: hypothetical protein CSA50_02360 [Gammaproteobacteria bacterium]